MAGLGWWPTGEYPRASRRRRALTGATRRRSRKRLSIAGRHPDFGGFRREMSLRRRFKGPRARGGRKDGPCAELRSWPTRAPLAPPSVALLLGDYPGRESRDKNSKQPCRSQPWKSVATAPFRPLQSLASRARCVGIQNTVRLYTVVPPSLW
jgi:hypothetical protein